MAWRFWRRQGRRRTHSRPRVASAAEAAGNASFEMRNGRSAGLGSALAGTGIMLLDAPMGGGRWGGQSLGVVPSSWRAAPIGSLGASGRTAATWDEALLAWMSSEDAAMLPQPAPQTVERRRHVWHEIDRTLGALRAG